MKRTAAVYVVERMEGKRWAPIYQDDAEDGPTRLSVREATALLKQMNGLYKHVSYRMAKYVRCDT